MNQIIHDDVRSIFSFVATMSGLHNVLRFTQVFWKDYPSPKRKESVPEHTWRMLILLILIADRMEIKFNLLRTIKMILIHDVPELRAGDPCPLGTNGDGIGSHAFCEEARDKKHANERQACHELFSELPLDLNRELSGLWEEYAAGKTNEAKVAKALDKLEATMSVLEKSQAHIYQEHLIISKRLALIYADVDPIIKEITEIVIAQISTKYKRFEPSTWWKMGKQIRETFQVLRQPLTVISKHIPSWS